MSKVSRLRLTGRSHFIQWQHPLICHALHGCRHDHYHVIHKKFHALYPKSESRNRPSAVLIFFCYMTLSTEDSRRHMLKTYIFKCHQPRTEKVRVLSIDPLLNCRHDFFVRPEMTSTDILFQVWE